MSLSVAEILRRHTVICVSPCHGKILAEGMSDDEMIAARLAYQDGRCPACGREFKWAAQLEAQQFSGSQP